MSFLWSLFGFQQAEGGGPLADGYDGRGTQDVAITFHLPDDAPQTGENAPRELFGHRFGRYARILLGLMGYINTSVGGTADPRAPDRIYAVADGPLGNGAQPLPWLGYDGIGATQRPTLPPPPPPVPAGAPPGGGFPSATYVGRVEREARALRY